MKRCSGILLIVACFDLCFAETRWIRAESPNFQVLSSAGQRDSLETVRQFEMVRDFFVQAMGNASAGESRTRLVVFGSGKDYEPYKLKGYASAWYMHGRGRDTIVMGNTTAAMLPTAIHEYVHLVARHAGLNLPPWLNEGVAELYSTLQPAGNQVVVGKLIPGRMEAVRTGSWNLREVLSAGKDSPLYNEKQRVSVIYNVGWALTHMLALSAEFRPHFPRLVTTIQNGVDSINAIQQVYGLTPEALQKSLNRYVGSQSFQGSVFPIKLTKAKDRFEFSPADPMDVELTMLDLASHPGIQPAHKAGYADVARRYPNRPEPEIALAYLYLRNNEIGLGRLHLKKAVELGAAEPEVFYDYARLASNEDPAGSITCLEKFLLANPDHVDARIHLAVLEIQQNEPAKALEALKPVKNVGRGQAPRFFRALTYAQLRSGMRKDAAASAARWQQYASDAADAESAQRILTILAKGDLPTGSQSESSFRPEPGGPPRLARRQPSPPESGPTEIGLTPLGGASPGASAEPVGLKGLFVELTCTGEQAVLRVDVSGLKKSFLIRDGNEVILEGAGAARQELDCGPRNKPVPVEVFFEPEAGYDGRLTLLRFLHESR